MSNKNAEVKPEVIYSWHFALLARTFRWLLFQLVFPDHNFFSLSQWETWVMLPCTMKRILVNHSCSVFILFWSERRILNEYTTVVWADVANFCHFSTFSTRNWQVFWKIPDFFFFFFFAYKQVFFWCFLVNIVLIGDHQFYWFVHWCQLFHSILLVL